MKLTVIFATIASTDYTSMSGKCILTVTYTLNDSIITSKVITPYSIQWINNQSVPIYINPLDLSSPKYVPHDVFTILYICTCVGLISLIIFIYYIVTN